VINNASNNAKLRENFNEIIVNTKNLCEEVGELAGKINEL
jgi:hypothetical protein